MTPKEQAQDMILYYLRVASKGQGNIGGADNQSEIEAIITWTVEAAVKEVEIRLKQVEAGYREEIERLEARINDLESYHN